jgi:hypothetical protein
MKDGEKNMAYTRGSNANIIVGAAALFVTEDVASLTSSTVPTFIDGESYKETLALRHDARFRNVGYTNNGLEIAFAPDFGEVMVDQLLDTAKIFKQGMKVTLKTTLAEATLENLLLAIAGKTSDFGIANLGTVTETNVLATLGLPQTGAALATTLTGTGVTTGGTGPNSFLNITSGDLGDYPIERGIIAVGPGLATTGQPGVLPDSYSNQSERIYVAYRAVSIDSVTVSAKRDAATSFEVSFRLLPDNDGAYGKIVDRSY